jgi:4-amino-4-deoxy-L-arabinose transferase-like glycosyltransferase
MTRPRLALAIVLILGLGVRFGYLITTGNAYLLQSREGEIAHNIVAHGRWFVFNERARKYVVALSLRRLRQIDPGEVDYARLDRGAHWYPESGESIGSGLVLAGLWQLTGGQRYLPLQILQVILDSLTALLVWKIAMQLFKRRRAALLAAALYALYPPLAWLSVDPYNDIWAVDFTVALTAATLIAIESQHRRRWLVLCGTLAGVGGYFRPNLLVVPAVLALGTIPLAGWRTALRGGVCVTLIAALLTVPWTVRNYAEFHAFIPTNSSFWENMWGGLGELPNDFGATLGTNGVEREVRRARPDLRFESPAWDEYLKHRVISAIEGHPLFYLKLIAHRVAIATFFTHDGTWMRGQIVPVFAYSGGPLGLLVHRPFDLLEYLLQPALFLLAMLALAATWKGRGRQHFVLIALVVGVLVPYIAIHVEGRYLLPAALAYMIWIGLGADLLIERLRARRVQQPLQQQPRPRLAERLVQVAALRRLHA